MWFVWVFSLQSQWSKKPHWMCSWKYQTTQVQHLWEKFLSWGSSKKTLANHSPKQELMQVQFVWVFSLPAHCPKKAHRMCSQKSIQNMFWSCIKPLKKPMFHENKKNHKCDLWEYLAFRNCDLRSHIECVHEKLKPHQCNIYQKSFGLKFTFSVPLSQKS